MPLTRRFMLTLPERIIKEIEVIKKEIDESSLSTILRHAISLYLVLFRRRKQGFEVCIIRGKEIKVIEGAEFFPMQSVSEQELEDVKT